MARGQRGGAAGGYVPEFEDFVEWFKQTGYEMAPGYGDYLASQRASQAARDAVEHYQAGEYLPMASRAAEGAAEAITTVPGVGELASLAKGMSVPLGALMTAFHGSPHKFGRADAPSEMLDLNAPLSEQPEAVRRVLGRGYTVDGDDIAPLGVHRYSRGTKSPDNGQGFMLFADYPDRISNNYGEHHWVYDGPSVPAEDLREDILRVLEDNPSLWDHSGSQSASEVIDHIFPENIVDTAGWWDSAEFNSLVWEEILEPKGIDAVKTPDGLVLYNPDAARRVIDVDPDVNTGKELYEFLGGGEEAADALKQLGIPGIKS